MMLRTEADFMLDAWRRAAGMPEIDETLYLEPPAPMPLAEIRRTQCHLEFAELMHNRMIMGYFRYGDKRAFDFQPGYCLSFIRARLKAYEVTGNTEYLVDAANGCGLAFKYDPHPKRHFKAEDDVRPPMKG